MEDNLEEFESVIHHHTIIPEHNDEYIEVHVILKQADTTIELRIDKETQLGSFKLQLEKTVEEESSIRLSKEDYSLTIEDNEINLNSPSLCQMAMKHFHVDKSNKLTVQLDFLSRTKRERRARYMLECKQHTNENAHFFCFDCNTSYCSLCPDHNKHSTIDKYDYCKPTEEIVNSILRDVYKKVELIENKNFDKKQRNCPIPRSTQVKKTLTTKDYSIGNSKAYSIASQSPCENQFLNRLRSHFNDLIKEYEEFQIRRDTLILQQCKKKLDEFKFNLSKFRTICMNTLSSQNKEDKFAEMIVFQEELFLEVHKVIKELYNGKTSLMNYLENLSQEIQDELSIGTRLEREIEDGFLEIITKVKSLKGKCSARKRSVPTNGQSSDDYNTLNIEDKILEDENEDLEMTKKLNLEGNPNEFNLIENKVNNNEGSKQSDPEYSRHNRYPNSCRDKASFISNIKLPVKLKLEENIEVNDSKLFANESSNSKTSIKRVNTNNIKGFHSNRNRADAKTQSCSNMNYLDDYYSKISQSFITKEKHLITEKAQESKKHTVQLSNPINSNYSLNYHLPSHSSMNLNRFNSVLLMKRRIDKRPDILIYNCNYNKFEVKLLSLDDSKFKKFHQFSVYVNADNTIYISGGRKKSGKLARDFWKYSPLTDQIIRLKDMTNKRCSHGLVYSAVNNEIYAVGGYNTRTCERYSMLDDEWAELPELNLERQVSTLFFTNRRTLYAAFGFISEEKFDYVERLDISVSKEWQLIRLNCKGAIDLRLFNVGVIQCGYSSKFLICGGESMDESETDRVYQLDLVNYSIRSYFDGKVRLPSKCSFIDKVFLNYKDSKYAQFEMKSNNVVIYDQTQNSFRIEKLGNM